MRLARLAVLFSGLLAAQDIPPDDIGIARFGVSVLLPAGLVGQIYKLKEGTDRLPNFKKLKPIGTIYTHTLDVPPRSFSEGFPGVSEIFEWFAIDYTGRFWITEEGEYRFVLTSDDGAELLIDGKRIINNDGIHQPIMRDGTVKLKPGPHNIRVSYFQGPRLEVALILEVQPPNGGRRVFSTLDFKPPANTADTQSVQSRP